MGFTANNTRWICGLGITQSERPDCAFTIGMLTEAYRELFEAVVAPTSL